MALLVAVSAYTLVLSPAGKNTSCQSVSLESTSVAQSSLTLPFQENSMITCLDARGGHFFAQVGFGIESNSGGPGTMVVPLTPGQASNLEYGQDLEVKMTYAPLQRVMFDSLGKVTGLSQAVLTIALINSTMPTTVPAGWNPKMGDEVVLTFSPESSPLVAITGIQLTSSSSRFAATVTSPDCLRQRQQGVLMVYGICVMKAEGQQIDLQLSFSEYPSCYASVPLCTVSVTTTDPGFSVSGVQPLKTGLGVTVALTTPSIGFAGDIRLVLNFTQN